MKKQKSEDRIDENRTKEGAHREEWRQKVQKKRRATRVHVAEAQKSVKFSIKGQNQLSYTAESLLCIKSNK